MTTTQVIILMTAVLIAAGIVLLVKTGRLKEYKETEEQRQDRQW